MIAQASGDSVGYAAREEHNCDKPWLASSGRSPALTREALEQGLTAGVLVFGPCSDPCAPPPQRSSSSWLSPLYTHSRLNPPPFRPPFPPPFPPTTPSCFMPPTCLTWSMARS